MLSTVISFRLPVELYTAIQARAAQEGSTATSLMIKSLTKDFLANTTAPVEAPSEAAPPIAKTTSISTHPLAHLIPEEFRPVGDGTDSYTVEELLPHVEQLKTLATKSKPNAPKSLLPEPREKVERKIPWT